MCVGLNVFMFKVATSSSTPLTWLLIQLCRIIVSTFTLGVGLLGLASEHTHA